MSGMLLGITAENTKTVPSSQNLRNTRRRTQKVKNVPEEHDPKPASFIVC